MNLLRIVLTLSLVQLFACSSESPDMEVEKLFETELAVFQSPDLPLELEELFEKNEVIVLGEIHYVQEHQDFILDLLPLLSKNGYKVIYDELFQSFSWLATDYVLGKMDEIPEYLRFFQNTLLEGIRAHNANQPDSQKISLAYFDLNHWDDNFLEALQVVEDQIGEQDEFAGLKNLDVTSSSYQNELRKLANSLSFQSASYQTKWGMSWYDRITQMVMIEIESQEYRLERNSAKREQIMHDIILQHRQKINGKILINTGLVHAQKQVYLVKGHDRIGSLLHESIGPTSSIVTLGLRGEKKAQFFDENNTSFDLPNQSDRDDLIVLFEEYAPGHQSFLSLNHPIFRTTDHKMSYATGARVNAPIGLQFDAIVAYPSISVVQSMTTFDWRH